MRSISVLATTAVSAMVLLAGCTDSGPAGGAGPGSARATTTRPLRHFTVAASGDILLHNPVIVDGRKNTASSGYDFNPMFDGVRDVISAA